MKVILNKCFGGFRPSREAYELYVKKKGQKLFAYELAPDLTYRRTSEKDGLFITFTTRDYGDNPKSDDFDWENDVLYLNSDYREDPVLIEVVEELGEKASAYVSDLRIVDIPDGMDYVIDDYDGVETLHARVQEW